MLCFLCDVPTSFSRPSLLSNSSDKISEKLVCVLLFHPPGHVWESLRMTEFSGLSFFFFFFYCTPPTITLKQLHNGNADTTLSPQPQECVPPSIVCLGLCILYTASV